jgi:hypothetical protein
VAQLIRNLRRQSIVCVRPRFARKRDVHLQVDTWKLNDFGHFRSRRDYGIRHHDMGPTLRVLVVVLKRRPLGGDSLDKFFKVLHVLIDERFNR